MSTIIQGFFKVKKKTNAVFSFPVFTFQSAWDLALPKSIARAAGS
jgi:hypothetical protein